MGKLIAVIGNCGAGKTSLARKLCEHYRLVPLFEQHAERPFQALFQSDLERYALANQVDYLLYRAEQERDLRGSGRDGIADGGLDQDFYIFTKLFNLKGFLNDHEYMLCERLYHSLRATLPPPDLFIRLSAPLPALIKRRAGRTRSLDIVTAADLPVIEDLMRCWMSASMVTTITFDTSAHDPDYSETVRPLLDQLDRFLSLSTPR